MIQKNDAILIEYVGKVQDSGRVFDTTSEDAAKKNGIWNKNVPYGPAMVIVGEGFLLPGFDAGLEGKKAGDSFNVVIPPEKGFGKRNPGFVKLIPGSFFKKQQINPYPGLPIMVDNVPGTVITASPGRVIVDFNHPLCGKSLVYEVKIIKIVDDAKEVVSGVMTFLFGQEHGFDISVSKDEITVSGKKEINEGLQERIKKMLKETLKNKYTLLFNIKQ